jgi:alpha/beta superfamily hydrolase
VKHAAPQPGERAVEFGDGVRGTLLALPEAETAAPCVVLLHGFGGHRNEVGNLLATLAARLAERGIASLRFDFPGCGESEGDFAGTTIDRQVAAARHALRFAATQASGIGLLGFSFGAAVACACLDDAFGVRALVLWAPVAEPKSDMTAVVGSPRVAEAERGGSVSIPWGERSIALKREFFRSLDGAAPLMQLAEFTGDVLAIAGDADPFSKHLTAIGAATKRARRSEASCIKGADHFFDVLKAGSRVPDLVTTVTADFFASSLGAH